MNKEAKSGIIVFAVLLVVIAGVTAVSIFGGKKGRGALSCQGLRGQNRRLPQGGAKALYDHRHLHPQPAAQRQQKAAKGH